MPDAKPYESRSAMDSATGEINRNAANRDSAVVVFLENTRRLLTHAARQEATIDMLVDHLQAAVDAANELAGEDCPHPDWLCAKVAEAWRKT